MTARKLPALGFLAVIAASFALAPKASAVVTLISVTIDSTEPNITLANPIPVTVTFGEAVTGFDQADVMAVNGTVTDFAGMGADYSFSVVPTVPGFVEIDLAQGAGVGDMSGDDSEASSFLIDYDVPRPDLRVGPRPNANTHRGNNVYGRTSFSKRGIRGSGLFFFSLQNDSRAADRLVCRSNRNARFRVLYRAGSRNVTGAMRRGGFQVALGGSAVQNLRAQVSAERRSASIQTFRDSIRANSVNGGAQDRLQVTLQYLPTSLKPTSLIRR